MAGEDSRKASFVRRDLSILLLAVAGAGVDAVVLLRFDVLTAAQTGNTILLATALAKGRLTTGLGAAVSIVGYIVGAAIGELVIIGRPRNAGRRGAGSPRSSVAGPLLAELIPLGGLLLLWHLDGLHPARGAVFLLVALAAVAMGIQSAAVLLLHGGRTTTYVTGMLTIFTTRAIRRLRPIEMVAAAPPPRRGAPARLLWRGPWTFGATWIIYAAGAVLGAIVFVRAGEVALLLPIAVVLAVVALEARDR